MKEAFEKIIERLEEVAWWTPSTFDCDGYSNDDSEEVITLDRAIEIVNQVEEEYSNSEIPNKLLDSLHAKILKSKFAEEVTEQEIDALVKAKMNMSEKPTSSDVPEINVGKNDGWILYSEEKPPLGKRVLLSVDVDGEMIIEIAERNGDFEWLFDDEFYSYTEANWRVIAWQPLPEPYQPKGE